MRPGFEASSGPGMDFEVKLDGYRAIGVKTSGDAILYSRNRKNFNKQSPDIAEALFTRSL